ncbi:hypothetical protein LRH25_02930 [Ideonella azotifigens]|uniref:PEP-CTERM sorting domain-containing protein n=1 Tax=Ideonella azotifigens TaxID=513160 RepID=A0ABN1KKF6_9BURK|nr:hypothetical protein [Ideonella azotifigens]MCD2339289.1 hypothetical protein [Ideonella azotifigens]
MNRSLSILGAAASTLIASSVFAAHPQAAAAPSNTAAFKATETLVTAAEPDTGLSTLYSNFSKDAAAVYDCCTGWSVAGPAVFDGVAYDIGMPFTPRFDGIAKRIKLAAGYTYGPDIAVVSLRADENGLPGAVLKKFDISDIPQFGLCCERVSGDLGKGVLLSAGTQYWVVMSTKKKTPDADIAWNATVTASPTPIAYARDGVWFPDVGRASAFKVLGVRAESN